MCAEAVLTATATATTRTTAASSSALTLSIARRVYGFKAACALATRAIGTRYGEQLT
jgi:hypothetical protein